MDLTLKTLIASDPQNGDPGRTTAQVAAWLTEDLPVIGRASGGACWGWATVHGIVPAYEGFKVSGNDAQKTLAYGLLGMLARGQGIDLADPESQILLAANVDAGMLLQAAADDLNVRGTVYRTRWAAAGLPKPRYYDIQEAHNG